jgi:hypothetical protein
LEVGIKMLRKVLANKQVIWLFFVVLLLKAVEAQEDLATPIEPDLVFAAYDLIEIVETLPLYFAEQERVNFYDFNHAVWQSYDYPDFPLMDGETAWTTFTENADGSFMLKVEYFISCMEDCENYGEGYIDYTPPQAAKTRERWHFDPDTGTFTPFESECGNLAQALSGQGEWVLNLDNADYYLCNTETGQRSERLTDLPERFGPALLAATSLSLDNRFLIFSYPYDLSIFAYDFQENQLNLLGMMQRNSPFFSIDYPKMVWVDNLNLIIENATSNYGDDHYYLYRANVTQPNSLELIYHNNSTHAYTLRLEEPLRYVWVGKQFPDAGTNTESLEEDCTIHEYTPATNTVNSYYIQGICSYGWTIPDGTDDRLAVQYANVSDTRHLIRFNPTTNLFEEILTANIQGLAGFSPDGHYAVLTIDAGDYNFQIIVLDLQTKTIVEPLYSIHHQYAYVQWINSHTFWMNTSNAELDAIFTISANHLIAQFGKFYRPNAVMSPDSRFMLVESDRRTLDILDIATLETITIAQVPDGTVIYGTWDDDGLITITLWYEDYHQERIGRWRVRLDV